MLLTDFYFVVWRFILLKTKCYKGVILTILRGRVIQNKDNVERSLLNVTFVDEYGLFSVLRCSAGLKIT